MHPSLPANKQQSLDDSSLILIDYFQERLYRYTVAVHWIVTDVPLPWRLITSGAMYHGEPYVNSIGEVYKNVIYANDTVTFPWIILVGGVFRKQNDHRRYETPFLLTLKYFASINLSGLLDKQVEFTLQRSIWFSCFPSIYISELRIHEHFWFIPWWKFSDNFTINTFGLFFDKLFSFFRRLAFMNYCSMNISILYFVWSNFTDSVVPRLKFFFQSTNNLVKYKLAVWVSATC